MPTAPELLAALRRDHVGPALRAHGFRGSGPTWRRRNEHGDAALVRVQTASGTTAAEARFAVGLELHPAVAVPEGVVPPQLADRLGAAGGDRWWHLTDEASARAAAAEVTAPLAQEGIPLLEALLHREVLLDALRRGEAGFAGGRGRADVALLLLLGPTPEREEVAERVLADDHPPSQAHRERLVAWARGRAE